jgi:hypothetical protein
MDEVLKSRTVGMDRGEGNEIRRRLLNRSLKLSQWLCALIAALSLLAAAGWIFNVDLLTRIHPSLPAIQPNTALALILGSVGILLTSNNQRSRRRHLAACAIGVIVCLFGLFTLCEYVFSWNLGIDSILIRNGAAGRLYPGRISPQTAANFALTGAALIIFNVRSLPIRLGQSFALAVGANAIVAMTGYIFSTREFYGFPPIQSDIGMAVHTAICFILATLAIMCSRPNDGFQILVTVSLPKISLTSSTDSGKPPQESGGSAPGSGCPSPRASLKCMADGSGSRA